MPPSTFDWWQPTGPILSHIPCLHTQQEENDMLLDHANQTFDQCIKCTVCTAYCPVAKANPAYPGPKQAGPDESGCASRARSSLTAPLKYCTNCKRCEVACPSGVRIGDIIAKAKHQYSGFKPGIREFVLSHTDLMGSMSTLMSPGGQLHHRPQADEAGAGQGAGVSSHRDLPKYSQGTFRGWYKSRKRVRPALRARLPTSTAAASTTSHPQLGRELVQVLNAMNIGVQLLEREKCCSVPRDCQRLHGQGQAAGGLQHPAAGEHPARQRDAATSHLLHLGGFTLRDEYPTCWSRTTTRCAIASAGDPLPVERVLPGQQTGDEAAQSAHRLPHPCHMEKMGVIYTWSCCAPSQGSR